MSRENRLGDAPRHVVLVHGAAHTGQCWELLEPTLVARGFMVHAPTLGGQAGTQTLPADATIASYVEEVRAVIKAIGEPVALLGHSLGGFTIAGVAESEPDLVSRLIFLCAFVPRFGDASLLDIAPVSDELREAGELDHDRGVLVFRPEAAKSVFYARCSEQVRKRAVELLSPQPLAPLTGSVTVSEDRFGRCHKTYIECTDDRGVPIGSQRAMQRYVPFDRIQSIDSDHSAFYSKPGELADLIAEAVVG